MTIANVQTVTTATTTVNDFLPYAVYEPTADDMREWNLAMDERDMEDEMGQDWAEEADCSDDSDDDGYTDAEADAMTLRDAGMGMDEDYNDNPVDLEYYYGDTYETW